MGVREEGGGGRGERGKGPSPLRKKSWRRHCYVLTDIHYIKEEQLLSTLPCQY